MSYLHERGLKGYVAFNVLVFDSELESVEEWGRVMACAGVDAVIVQVRGVRGGDGWGRCMRVGWVVRGFARVWGEDL